MTSFSLSGSSVFTVSLGDVLGSLQNPVSSWAKNAIGRTVTRMRADLGAVEPEGKEGVL